MSQINTILIKRRLGSSPNTSIPSLSGGELAFSEKNNTLYYGGEFGTLAIAGSGAFVSLNGDQTISGNKTLLGTTTLSSITVSPDSLIDFGNNVLTNVAYPSAADHAANKQYVDDNYIPVTTTGDFVNRTDAQDVSGVKTFFLFDQDLIQSGINLPSDQSPPPTTFPALAVAIKILLFFLLRYIKKHPIFSLSKIENK